ncbi:MAG TPA: glycosyltransferase family A protein, partial [Jatrophihabitans sp.]|nr:glycosyltransferase family A protein [Jatrophihabitans sp.]
MAVRVSVIVAVYNTGEYIEPLLASLREQTLPADEYEVILVDDGSTDEWTIARIDREAAEQPNVTVRHEPNSGWPGRPRNVGMDAARGRYVFFADHDDWFGVEALERMAAYADECGSDVLVPRYAGHHRGVAKAMFGRSQCGATLESTPLLDSLTPHKLFRLEFLREQGLRFPEGKRRLEDHVFVVDAYFRAATISVLADYHCYFHVGRPDAGNAAFNRIDPPSYYGYVREVVDLIYAHTSPGPLRDRLLRRPLRQEVLGRLDGAAFLDHPRAYRQALFDECRRLTAECFPPALDAGLSPPQRLRAELLRAGRLDDLVDYVRHQVDLRCTVRLEDVRWSAGGELELELTGRLVDGRPDRPVRYPRRDGVIWLPAPPLEPPVAVEVDRGTSPLASGRLGVVLRRRADSQEWPLRVECVQQLDEQDRGVSASYRAVARLDPASASGGAPLPGGVWDFYASISQTGWAKSARLGGDHSEPAEQGTRSLVLGGVRYRPYWTAGVGALSLAVGEGDGGAPPGADGRA